MHQHRKHILELTPRDFEQHPVWYDFVDDDDIVVAIDEEEVDLMEGIYFCKSIFQFANGEVVHGYTRIVDGEIISIDIWSERGEFETYSLLEEVRRVAAENASTFASNLGRATEDVFPLQFTVAVGGQKITGVITAATSNSIKLEKNSSPSQE